MKFVSLDGYLPKFFSGDFPSLWVLPFVQPSMNFQAFPGRCRTYEVHDYLMSLQRHALPVSCDVTEETMLDLVPFARPGRIMTRLENHPGLVGEFLQLP